MIMADGNELMVHHRKRVLALGDGADVWFKLQATSPFLRVETVNLAVRCMRQFNWFDSLFTYVEVNDKFLWRDTEPLYREIGHGRTQDWPEMFISETHGIKAIRENALLRLGKTVGNRPFPLEVSGKEALDVDYESDLAQAEKHLYNEAKEDLAY